MLQKSEFAIVKDKKDNVPILILYIYMHWHKQC